MCLESNLFPFVVDPFQKGDKTILTVISLERISLLSEKRLLCLHIVIGAWSTDCPDKTVQMH